MSAPASPPQAQARSRRRPVLSLYSVALTMIILLVLVALAAPLIAPFDPFDPAQISLWDGKLPPAWAEGGQAQYLLGTDNQGRDMLSTILYGGRLSILVGLTAVALGMTLGVALGVTVTPGVGVGVTVTVGCGGREQAVHATEPRLLGGESQLPSLLCSQ